MRDYRTIPLDVLRDFARSCSEETSIRIVAREVGVGRSTAYGFITGNKNPQPRVKRLFALWYLDRINGPRINIIDLARPYASAVSTLLSEIPTEGRAVAIPMIFAGLRAGYTCGGVDMPPWLPYLHEVNGIEASSQAELPETSSIPVGMASPLPAVAAHAGGVYA